MSLTLHSSSFNDNNYNDYKHNKTTTTITTKYHLLLTFVKSLTDNLCGVVMLWIWVIAFPFLYDLHHTNGGEGVEQGESPTPKANIAIFEFNMDSGKHM